MPNIDNSFSDGLVPSQSGLNTISNNDIQPIRGSTSRRNGITHPSPGTIHDAVPSAPQPSHQLAGSASNYDDEPPPYPLEEISTIGWSPKVAIVNNNPLPTTQLTMPMPMIQNITMPLPPGYNSISENTRPVNLALPITNTISRNDAHSRTSSNTAPHINPARNRTTTTTSYPWRNHRRFEWNTISQDPCSSDKCGIFVTIGIIVFLGILMVITIRLVTHKSIDVYRN